MKAKTETLALSSAQINRNWRLKVYGVDAAGRRINKLVGVAGLVALIGVEMLNKFFAPGCRLYARCLPLQIAPWFENLLLLKISPTNRPRWPFLADVGSLSTFQNKSNTRKI